MKDDVSKIIFLWQRFPGETNSRDGLELRRFATYVFKIEESNDENMKNVCGYTTCLFGSSVRVPTHEKE